MKITCPHCAQHLELDPETLIALEGASHFDCPTCGGAVEVSAPVQVPTKKAAPRREGKSTSGKVVRQTQQGMNRNLLVLGVVALLAIGGVAIFLASKNGGNVFNIFQNTTKQIINNSYFTQLIADGVTTKADLESIAEIRPYGEGFVGVSKAELNWERAEELAMRTGSQILAVETTPAGSTDDLVAWLGTTFRSPNPLRPRAFGGKGAEGMRKEIPSNNKLVSWITRQQRGEQDDAGKPEPAAS